MESLDWGRYILSLLMVGGLIVGLAWAAKRIGLAAKLKQTQSLHGHMEVVDTLYLSPRQRIMLVRCKGKEHMVLLSGDQAQHITSVEG